MVQPSWELPKRGTPRWARRVGAPKLLCLPHVMGAEVLGGTELLGAGPKPTETRNRPSVIKQREQPSPHHVPFWEQGHGPGRTPPKPPRPAGSAAGPARGCGLLPRAASSRPLPLPLFALAAFFPPFLYPFLFPFSFSLFSLCPHFPCSLFFSLFLYPLFHFPYIFPIFPFPFFLFTLFPHLPYFPFFLFYIFHIFPFPFYLFTLLSPYFCFSLFSLFPFPFSYFPFSLFPIYPIFPFSYFHCSPFFLFLLFSIFPFPFSFSLPFFFFFPFSLPFHSLFLSLFLSLSLPFFLPYSLFPSLLLLSSPLCFWQHPVKACRASRWKLQSLCQCPAINPL